MSAAITIDSLKLILGREVEEIHLTIAKSSVLGLDPETIATTLGVTKAEIEQLMETQDYKDIRLLVGAEQAKERVDRDYGWDGIESAALRKLGRRTELENDTDTLLRIAAVANRATRRAAPPKESILDPSQAGARVQLTLTRRFTDKMSGGGQVVERTETQQISVLNGSAVNPTFKEVQGLLHGTPAGGAATERGVEVSLADSLTIDDKELIKGLMMDPAKPITKTMSQTREVPEQDDDFSLESLRAMAKGIRGHG